eukprot:gene4749-5926_t
MRRSKLSPLIPIFTSMYGMALGICFGGITGEREEGYDTMESYGGIFNVLVGDRTQYPSELGNGGKVGWITAPVSSTPGSLSLDWSDIIDWSFLQQVWGWNIWLWYGYAVGTVTISQSGNYILQCTGTRTYFLKNSNNNVQEFTGDFYGYGVGQQVSYLEQGSYSLYVKMTSSVRLSQSPQASFQCQIIPSTSSLQVIQSETLVPDIVAGNLTSSYASVTVVNTGGTLLRGVTASVKPNQSSITSKLVNRLINSNNYENGGIDIPVGQKMVLSMELTYDGATQPPLQCPFQIAVDVVSATDGLLQSTNLVFNCTEYGNPYLFTFLDFDSTVQYAIAKPPIYTCDPQTPCGVMVATHGAGVEASSQFWMDAIPTQPNLWILYPTGRRSWGYDWEGPSRANVFSALSSLSNSVGSSIDTSKIFFVGHSMGGHGCWSLLSHYGDLALAGACAAGFVKLQFYVMFNTRPGFSYVDPILQGLLMASIAENDNDLYSSNLVGLPLMARYGQNDTNVNPWHSRRMARMVCEQSQNESAVIISEVPNSGHWFNGILSDTFMQDYYNSIIANGLYLPPIPKTIIITTNNPASSGPRANINILQTLTTGRVGRIQLTQSYQGNDLVWTLSTQNIRRFGIEPNPIRDKFPSYLIVDGTKVDTGFLPTFNYFREGKWNPIWNLTSDTTWIVNERSPLTYGPIRQIFEKPFTIIYGTNTTSEMADQFEWGSVYISNFWNTYGRGSPQIIPDTEFQPPSSPCGEQTNYILLGNSYENIVTSKYQNTYMPVFFDSDGSFSISQTSFNKPGTGVAFLSPNECGQGLLLVISGIDPLGFNKVLHALPQRSGVVVPDYIVVGNDWGWKGPAGILSCGFWDPNWLFNTDSSYIGLQSDF